MHPPRKALAFLRWFCREDYLEEIEGDLIEIFGSEVEDSPRKAKWKFSWSVLKYFRPGFIRSFSNSNQFSPMGMYKIYFKIGWRNLLKQKGNSSLNIIGLATGMAVAILIGLWVFDELSFNRYFKNYERIAQVTKAGNYEGKYYMGQKHLPFPLIEELQSSYGQNFKHIVPISGPDGFDAVLSTDDKILTRKGMYIGEGAPEMFSWEMKYGSWNGLEEIQGIMISESTSKAFFGDSDPMGKAMKVNKHTDVTVTGVFEDFPKNTEFYGMMFFEPWDFYLKDAPFITRQGWDNNFVMVYVETAPNVTMQEAGAAIKSAEKKATENLDFRKQDGSEGSDVLLLPMADWHLYADFRDGELQNGPIQMVRFIAAIGVFVLLLACINFMNLSTARSERRAKEVGIRKTMGSIRSQLIGQFFSESFLVVILSFLLALIVAYTVLPSFNQLAGKELVLPLADKWFWLSCLSFITFTGLLAGSYPAFYLSSFKPISVLKGTFRAGRFSALPRKTLVVLQFVVSVGLISCTAAIYHQLMYVKDRPVGYSREGLISVRKKSDEFNTKALALREELKRTGMVTEVAESGGDVTGTWSHNGGFNWEGKDPGFEAYFATLNVSPEFGKTVGWEFVDGRDFVAEMASDSSGIVLNEAAVKYMNLEDPVGKTIRWTNRSWNVDQDFVVLGVIKDMLMNSPFEPVKPAVYVTYGYERVLLMRITPGISAAEALPKIEKVFTQLIPEIPFDYRFVDQEFDSKFSTEDRIGKLAGVFAVLAIFISCLGLFGLASFVAERRTKEIGIRKVLGASVLSTWRLLSQEFVLLVLLACLIAVPLAYLILEEGLQKYEYRTGISWWIFVMAASIALGITLLTVSFQAIKAALMNPVKSLKSE
ncbi:ABC transporter permease [Algoriphagus terrigena]|uniref:ABC transporter permease n=1 Tax=Algoriphagus terrigena TaxID=344884 RepID=UPI0004120497|nr:ABC transporter permease [Algoriphagus terrigena]